MSPKLKEKCRRPFLRISSDPFKDDVYSFGVTLSELAATCLPDFLNAPRIFDHLRSLYPQAKLVDIIQLMMEPD